MGLFEPKEKIENQSERKISPTRIIIAGFFLIILLGAFLLMLPVSTRSGKGSDFLTALFTATSATCVTGLVVVDTLAYWSTLGQVIIIALIQCGGLGFMAFATVFSLLLHRRISLRERLVMTQSFSVNEISGVVRLAKHILAITFSAEGIGALILATRFVPRFGWADGLFKSVFHSISAFCNAGFDIMGLKTGIGSIADYVGDPVVCLTMMALTVFGGLGFLVWENIREHRRFKCFNLHTKLVLIMTGSLLVVGTLLFFIFEYENPATMAPLNVFEKLLASGFQSVSTRTAGFYSISQGGMTTVSKMMSIILMFIGGSPGSTAGGIKTVTLAVLIITAISVMRSRAEITAFERKISISSVLNAIAVTIVALSLVIASAIVITIIEQGEMLDVMFETVSAFSTTGLSTGITPGLRPISKFILILLMYFGRVGLLTMSLGLLVRRKPSKIGYPEGKIIVG